jgi:hypothetical protein
VSVVVEIGELVAPLCYYAQRVFEEGHNDQESANCWYVSVGAAVSENPCREPRATPAAQQRPKSWQTHGFSGSDQLSRMSSILLVCTLSWSSGLGSFLVSSLRPALPKGLWLPRW